MSYEPPIHIIDNSYDSITDAIEEHARRVAEGVDEMIVEACIKVGCAVDKDELVKALEYDRGQYEKGYADGKRDAASPWHRAEEPPKKTAKYLVWVDVNNGVFAAYPELRTAAYNAVYERWYVDGDQRTEWIGTPRYWMPIEPPKEDA